MAGQKFLQLSGGKATTVTSVQTGGSGKENLIPSLDAAGKLDITMMPTGIGADTITAEASEALSAGNFVNLYVDTTLKVRAEAERRILEIYPYYKQINLIAEMDSKKDTKEKKKEMIDFINSIRDWSDEEEKK